MSNIEWNPNPLKNNSSKEGPVEAKWQSYRRKFVSVGSILGSETVWFVVLVLCVTFAASSKLWLLGKLPDKVAFTSLWDFNLDTASRCQAHEFRGEPSSRQDFDERIRFLWSWLQVFGTRMAKIVTPSGSMPGFCGKAGGVLWRNVQTE